MAEPLPPLIVEGRPYQLKAGDRVICDSRNGTIFVHNVDDDDVYFRAGDHLVSRLVIPGGLTKESARSTVEALARQHQRSGAVQEVEGSFPTLFTFVVNA